MTTPKPIVKTEEENNIIKNLLTYLPILTLSSLGIGIINLSIYYHPFNLDILTYIEINEIILTTITTLAKSLFILLILQIPAELFAYWKNKKLEITDRESEKSVIKLSYRTGNILFGIFLLIAFLLFIFLYNGIDSKIFKELSDESNIVTISLVIFIITAIAFPLYIPRIYETNYFFTYKLKYTTIYFTISCLLFYTICISSKNAADTILYSTYGTYIEIGNKKIVSNMNYYYIGRTKSFIFFYNSKDNQTDVYQNKDVTKLSINNNLLSKILKKEFGELRESIDSIKHINKISNTIKMQKVDSIIKYYENQHLRQ